MMTLNPQSVCRCCLLEHPTITYNIFERDNLYKDLMEFVPKLNVTPNDGLPDLVCDLCWLRIKEAVDFKRKCEEVDLELRKRFGRQTNDCQYNNNLGSNNGFSILENNISSSTTELDSTFLSTDESMLSSPMTLCELSPLEVSMLNDLLLEDCNNQNSCSSSRFRREEDPLISELLNTVLRDTDIENLSGSIDCSQSSQISSTTNPSITSAKNKTRKNKKLDIHTCNVCGKQFTRNFQLKLHLTSAHNIGEGLQYQCQICEKNFASRHSLHYHHKSLHTEEREFACTQCDRRFVLRSQLASHERIHTGESKPRIHQCPQCDKTWPTKSDLRTHMRSHDPNVERRFQCGQCEKRFYTRGHLASHFLVHTGEKPFPCSLCNRKYQSVGNLNSHMMKRHSEVAALNRSSIRQRHNSGNQSSSSSPVS